MNARTASRVAGALWVLNLLLLVVNLTLGVLNGSFQHGEDVFFLAVGIVMAVGYATVGSLIAARHHRNTIGWLYLFLALGLMAGILSEEYPVYALRTAATDLPGAAWVAWVGRWMLPLALAGVPLVFLLFPTGRVPSGRWRPLAWLIVGAAALATTGLIVDPRPIFASVGLSVDNPTGVEALRGTAGVIIALGGLPLAGSALVSVVALLLRFRRAPTEERQQIKWLAYVALLGAFAFIGSFITGVAGSWLNDIFFSLTVVTIAVGIPVASGIALLRYRLFDIDIVINKTVVYVVLAAFVTLVYVVVVVAVPVLLFGAQGGFNPLPFAAAAIVALAFQPVRRWASRLANRLVYGKRATPYEVLSEFAARMGGTYSAEDVLPRMARILGEGCGAARAEVWLRVGGQLRLEAMWPSEQRGARRAVPLDRDQLPDLPGIERAVPVRHHGDLLGALAVTARRGETFTPANDKLADDLASQAGLVLRNVRLIEELRESRQRLVAAQDEERRRLERNIHDGAQQQLVALAVKLRLAENLAGKEAPKVAGLLADLRGETQSALEDLRDLARGIYPPLLADKGLAPAIEAQARKSAVPVDVEPDSIGRYPPEVETGVYFCVLEALQNVAKYAGAARTVVRLTEENGNLVFEVEDDGRGFDPERTPRGAGLQNMADRLDALGGTLVVRSVPAEGTTVRGWIPVESR